VIGQLACVLFPSVCRAPVGSPPHVDRQRHRQRHRVLHVIDDEFFERFMFVGWRLEDELIVYRQHHAALQLLLLDLVLNPHHRDLHDVRSGAPLGGCGWCFECRQGTGGGPGAS